MSGHNVLSDIYNALTAGSGQLNDPGNAGTITLEPGISHGCMKLISTGAETRTLADPSASGLELFLEMTTDGGDITITASSAYDETGGTTLTFSAVGQCVHLKSVEDAAGTYAWRVMGYDGVTGPSTQLAGGDFSGNVTIDGTLIQGSNETDRVTIKGIYMSPANVVVAVPTIADAEIDEVAVDVSTAFAMQPAVGDAVIAIPAEALMTDAILCGAYVSSTDEITVSFAAKEGGAGVTGANKNFKFLVIDLT